MQGRVTGLSLGLLLNAVAAVSSCTPQKPAAQAPGSTAAPRDVAAEAPAIRVNQLGYLPERAKIAVLVMDATRPQAWKLVNGSGQILAQGEAEAHGADATSGDRVQIIDFTEFRQEASGLKIVVADLHSDPFDVRGGLYGGLGRDALRFFYHMRSGTPIEMPYAEQPQWARPAGHRPDLAQCASGIGCDYSLDVTGGWYDAGDQGKYVVNGGFSVWVLQNAYERALILNRKNSLLLDRAENIPESGNGVPDILDEARWELTFLLAMQVPPGRPHAGMAHHKMHDAQWTALGTAPHEDTQKRILRPPTTAATLNLAASAAQAARLWTRFDAPFAARCLTAAETAWQAANTNPLSFSPASDSVGGGAYADQNVEDELYWAAAELFLTTGKPEYRKRLTESSADQSVGADLLIDGEASASAVTWERVDVLGKISLALVPWEAGPRSARDEAGSVEIYRKQLLAAASQLLVTASRQGYRFPMRPGPKGNYPWGSNADVLGNVLLLGSAADWTDDARYVDGLVAGMDYLLGRNAMGQSYVTGYGTRPLKNPHHRFWAHQANSVYPSPPPGCVSGGPNSDMQDPYVIGAGLRGCPLQKCFVDHINAYSVNEVAINWNAAMTWAAARLDEEGEK
jgi:endoglucanase